MDIKLEAQIKMDETKKLAEFSADVRYDDLPKHTVDMAKQCILDWLGVALRGSDENPARLLQKELMTMDGGDEATVLGKVPSRASALTAAFLNGAASHTLDFDDLHNASIVHIATVVVPPAIAVAEKERKSGRDVIAATVAGYEVAARVGESVVPESYEFWHTTATAGTFSAAAAAAHLLGLTTDETVHAFGSAGTQAAGLWEFVHEGAMSKPLHTGKACYAGVLSAYLARDGFTGATKILEGEKGFCRAMMSEPHIEKLTQNLGNGYKIDENSFKPYPCCKHSHAAIYAALTLKKKHSIEPRDVARVTLLVNSITDSLINNPSPETAYGCKFSIQYCAACALVRGNVTLDEFAERAMNDEVIRTFMTRIDVKRDDAMQKVYDDDPTKLASKVVIQMKDGRAVEMEVDYPKGDPQNPMTWNDTCEKFKTLAHDIIGDAKAEKCIDLVSHLESVDGMSSALYDVLK